jgi:hypothetical protein
MASLVIEKEIKSDLLNYLKELKSPELVSAYLVFISLQQKIQPVLFPKEKTIYLDVNILAEQLGKRKGLWHETEIMVHFGEESVNELTKRIYICPFTGKVFGDNTHPNPQDAIYDWVAKCPENTEVVNGLRAKRFYVSEDSEVIKSYIEKETVHKPLKRKVYSSVITGKLFNSKAAVIADFKENQVKPLSLDQVQSQNRFQIDEELLTFLQEQLTEEKITSFVEAIAENEEFLPYVQRWLGED